MTHVYRAGWFVVALAVFLALLGCREGAEETLAAPDNTTPAVDIVVTGLQEPVALAALSPQVWLVAERRAGRIRWIEAGHLRDAPLATLDVVNLPGYHEYGLLGLAVHPDYPAAPFVYAFHTVPDADGRAAGQRIVRVAVRDGVGGNPETVVDNLPAGSRCCHNGGRLLFGQDGMLYVTLGDTQRPEQAQDPMTPAGAVLRYTPEGVIPENNPFMAHGARSPVYTFGHRNPFGLARHPETGALYMTDNGPRGLDEINRLVAGDNYGWPAVMGYTDDPRFRRPLWSTGTDTLAPTGAAFYTGDALPQFRHQLFFASYADGRLRRAVFDGPDRIIGVEEVAAASNRARLDVAMGPDGHLYFTSMDTLFRLRAE